MANKKNPSLRPAKQRSARLKFAKKYKSSTKALLWKGARMIIFSWINAQNILFQLPNLKIQVIKKLKMNHLGLYTLHGATWLIPFNAATATECDKKKNKNKKQIKQRGHAGT